MRCFILIFLTFILAACTQPAKQNAPQPHPLIVAHVDAFNAKDIAAMGAVEHPDIEWLRVSGSNVTVDVSGRDALAGIMRDYMASNPTVVGTLHGWSVNGDYVSVTETATWTTEAGEERSQSALSVYQFEDGLIRRVWYYPAVSKDAP